MLGPPAIALVEPDHVEPGLPGFPGDAQHVMRIAASFETMDENHGRALFRVGLPMTIAQNARLRRNCEQSRFARQTVQQTGTRPIARDERHQVGMR